MSFPAESEHNQYTQGWVKGNIFNCKSFCFSLIIFLFLLINLFLLIFTISPIFTVLGSWLVIEYLRICFNYYRYIIS